MSCLSQICKKLRLDVLYREESGATAVEYAVLLALIMVSCISAILSTGDVQQALWFDTADRIEIIAP